MCAARRRNSTTEHGHAVSTRGYQSDPWSEERPGCSAPRSPPHSSTRSNELPSLTKVAPYQEPDPRLPWEVLASRRAAGKAREEAVARPTATQRNAASGDASAAGRREESWVRLLIWSDLCQARQFVGSG